MAEYDRKFFSKMTKQMLKGIRVNSKQELSDRIYKYFNEINDWTYKMDEIELEESIANYLPVINYLMY